MQFSTIVPNESITFVMEDNTIPLRSDKSMKGNVLQLERTFKFAWFLT